MNPRINKKIHKRYLSDVGIECALDHAIIEKLEGLEINEVLNLSNKDFPEGFSSLNPSASKYKLQYCAKRVEYSDIPRTDSGWWSVNDWTHFFAFYPKENTESKWYVASNPANEL